MAKLTKAQSKAHQKCEQLLAQETLTLDEKIFVLENWNEATTHDNTRGGAFFTPLGLANDFKLEVCGNRTIDLCAGIGALSFGLQHFLDGGPLLTCVEINPDYVRVGKKLLPEATWICGDIFEIWQTLPNDFDTAISNPPFGHVTASARPPRYTGGEFEYKIIDIAAQLANYGAFVLPQMSAPFRYSGVPCYERAESNKYKAFSEQTGISLEPGCGIDTSVFDKSWKHTCVRTEVVTAEFARAA